MKTTDRMPVVVGLDVHRRFSTVAGGKSRRAATPPPDGAATEPTDPESSDFVGLVDLPSS